MTKQTEALKIYAQAEYNDLTKWVSIHDEDETRWHKDNICFHINSEGKIIGVEWLNND